jgi:hypothetical protein
MWLRNSLTPDFKTIADFRKDNLQPIQKVCRAFTLLCKELDLFGAELVAIDGSKFKAVKRVVEQCAHVAAARLRSDTQSVSSLERVSVMLDPAQRISSGFVRTGPVERLTSTGRYITS